MSAGIYEALTLNQAPGWAEEMQSVASWSLSTRSAVYWGREGKRASICSAVIHVLEDEEEGHLTWLTGGYQKGIPEQVTFQ